MCGGIDARLHQSRDAEDEGAGLSVPAPATTSTGPFDAVTASCCAGLSSCA